MTLRSRTALAAGVLVFAAVGLSGCSGLSLPTSSAPEPSSSYPTIGPDSVKNDQCRVVVDEINALSRAMTQLSEAVERGDFITALSLLGDLQSGIASFGEGVSGDEELQALIEEAKGAAEELSNRLGTFDGGDPLAITDGVDGDLDRLKTALTELTNYCTV